MNNKRILIVDDDFAVADSIRMFLEEEGYLVSHISSGRSIQKIKKNLPDLLLLDVRLGKISGETICRQLRQDRHFDDMRIMLLSATENLPARAADACADGYISKPFNLEELQNKIKSILG